MILISLVSVLAIGCGSSQKDYVFTGNVPSTTTGNVRFLLDRALAQEGIIPVSSRSFEVEFFNSAGASVLLTNGSLAANESKFEVTVTGVPVSAVDFSLTIYDGPIVSGAVTGVPLLNYADDISVPAGNTITVDLDLATRVAVTLSSVRVNPNPVNLNVSTTRRLAVDVTYSNGDTFLNFPLGNTSSSQVVFASTNATIANVTPGGLVAGGGLVQGVASGNTTITATVTSYAKTVVGNTSAVVAVTPAI